MHVGMFSGCSIQRWCGTEEPGLASADNIADSLRSDDRSAVYGNLASELPHEIRASEITSKTTYKNT